MSEIFKTTSDRIETLNAERQAEIDHLTDEIHEATAEKTRAEMIAEAALTDGDDETYIKSMRRARAFDYKIGIHQHRIDVLTENMRVSEREYQAIRSAIIDELDQQNSRSKDIILAHLEAIFRESDSLRTSIGQGNGLLREWEAATNHSKTIPGFTMSDANYDRCSLVDFVNKIRGESAAIMSERS